MIRWIIVRRPSWGVETLHVDMGSLLDVWMSTDAAFMGLPKPERQWAIERLEEGPDSGIILTGAQRSVSYSVRRVEP